MVRSKARDRPHAKPRRRKGKPVSIHSGDGGVAAPSSVSVVAFCRIPPPRQRGCRRSSNWEWRVVSSEQRAGCSTRWAFAALRPGVRKEAADTRASEVRTSALSCVICGQKDWIWLELNHRYCRERRAAPPQPNATMRLRPRIDTNLHEWTDKGIRAHWCAFVDLLWSGEERTQQLTCLAA